MPHLSPHASSPILKGSEREKDEDKRGIGAEDRRFYLLGGKGGVGKTTSSAALAVHLATQSIPTLVVSTDPAHSLSDSFKQDLSGGAPVPLSDTELPIWGMEIDPAAAREELRRLAREDGGNEAFDMLKNVGLGNVAEQLKVRLEQAPHTRWGVAPSARALGAPGRPPCERRPDSHHTSSAAHP